MPPQSDTNPTTIQSEATAWWVRLDSDQTNPQQIAAFQQWLKQNPAHQTAFDKITQLWGELDAIKTLPIHSPNQCLPDNSINSRQHPFNFSRFLQYSSALALCCILAWISPLGLYLQADFHTDIGEMRTINLSDGSTVHLNSNSALSVSMSSDSRQLSLLKGEAWFIVSPDKNHPFQVHAESGIVTALGTAFNIRLHNDSAEVTVTEHSVAIALDQQTTRLEQGQRLTYNKQHGINAAQPVDTNLATAWQRGKLIFQNQVLGEVITELNRYYSHGALLISDDSIAQRRVNGVFHTDKPLAVIDALESALQIHTTRIGEYLIVLHR